VTSKDAAKHGPAAIKDAEKHVPAAVINTTSKKTTEHELAKSKATTEAATTKSGQFGSSKAIGSHDAPVTTAEKKSKHLPTEAAGKVAKEKSTLQHAEHENTGVHTHTSLTIKIKEKVHKLTHHDEDGVADERRIPRSRCEETVTREEDERTQI
jgi:hypothetical protein